MSSSKSQTHDAPHTMTWLDEWRNARLGDLLRIRMPPDQWWSFTKERIPKMARFYGTIKGARGPASRLGHKGSGLCVFGKSYNGDVSVRFEAGTDDADNVSVSVWDHNSSMSKFSLYYGDMTTLRKGGRVEVMRYLYEKCSPHQRRKFMELVARRALRTAYSENEDAQGD